MSDSPGITRFAATRRGTLPFGSRLNALSTTRLATILLVAVGLFTAFFELGGHRTLTGHEAYVAVCAREMLASGDWVVPTFGGVPRLEKPPLAYWIVAGLSAVFGRTDAWVTRLPSALATLGLALLMAHWARRRFGETAGLAAGAAQLSMGYVLLYGRRAEVDMLLVLLTTAATYLIVHQPDDESGRAAGRRWLAIWSLLGLSFLAKWHYGPAMVLGPFVLFQLIQRTPKRLLDPLRPAGLAVFVACVVVWPLLVLNRLPSAADVWWHETVDRALPGTFRDDPWWLYGPHLVGLTLPWTPLALMAVPACWRRAWREGRPHDRYLWVWFGVQFAIVTLQSNKHPHYLMAALPVFSLLAAETVARWSASRTIAPVGHGTVVRRMAIVVGVAIGGWFWATHRWPDLATPFTRLAATFAVATSIVVWSLAVRRSRTGVIAAVTGFGLCFAIVNAHVLPHLDRRADVARFAAEVRAQVGTDPVDVHVEAHAFGTSPVIFHLGPPVRRTDPGTPIDSAEPPRPRHVVTTSERVPSVLASPSARTTRIATGDLVLVEIGVGRMEFHSVRANAEPSPPSFDPRDTSEAVDSAASPIAGRR